MKNTSLTALRAPHAHEAPGRPGRLIMPTSPSLLMAMCGKLKNTAGHEAVHAQTCGNWHAQTQVRSRVK